MTKYQTFAPRFWAGLIDGLVFLPLGFLGVLLSFSERGPVLFIAWSIASYSSHWLYSVLLHARYGQTLGKMAMGVKVLNLSEDRIPTFRQAFIRDICYVALNVLALASLTYLVLTHQYGHDTAATSLPDQIIGYSSLGWFLLEIISMATNDKRRAFHDYLAGTVVIRVDQQGAESVSPSQTEEGEAEAEEDECSNGSFFRGLSGVIGVFVFTAWLGRFGAEVGTRGGTSGIVLLFILPLEF